MATNDSELVDEARNFAGYTSSDFSDSEVQEIVDIAKEELRADFDDASYTFWSGNLQADRALFWFTCIGLKVRAGEIGSIDLTIDDLEATDSNEEYSVWFSNFNRRRQHATTKVRGTGASTREITRGEDRTYSYERP